MIFKFLLSVPSFLKKKVFKKFTEFFQKYASISPELISLNAFNALYCKFRLVRLCPVFTDPVTYLTQAYVLAELIHNAFCAQG